MCTYYAIIVTTIKKYHTTYYIENINIISKEMKEKFHSINYICSKKECKEIINKNLHS